MTTLTLSPTQRNRQALVSGGILELQAAVDAGEITLAVGAELATMNKADQREALKGGPEVAKKKARQYKAAKKKADAGFDPNAFVDTAAAQWCEAADRVLRAAQSLPFNGALSAQTRLYVTARLRESLTLITAALQRIKDATEATP